MTPISPGRYLVAVEDYKLRRARGGHSFIAWGFRILRQGLGSPHTGDTAGALVEAICSPRSANYMNDMAEVAAACRVKLEVPHPLEHPTDDKLRLFAWEEATRKTLEPVLGKVVVIDARVSNNRASQRWFTHAFVSTSWSAPTPSDLAGNMSREELLALVAKLWRTLKDETTRHTMRVESALALIETLEVPR